MENALFIADFPIIETPISRGFKKLPRLITPEVVDIEMAEHGPVVEN